MFDTAVLLAGSKMMKINIIISERLTAREICVSISDSDIGLCIDQKDFSSPRKSLSLSIS